MNVNWNHILLDPLVYARHRTYRVARIPGGITAFPVARRGVANYVESWTPRDAESGLVPDAESPVNHYHINPDGGISPPSMRDSSARGFRFAFWSCLVQTSEGPRWGCTVDPRPSIPGVEQATAYFVWDFGGGPGEHGIYLDAFNEDTGEFLPDDFVTVNPDDREQTRTTAANNGLLMTNGINETTIEARESLLSLFFELFFNLWRIVFAPDDRLRPLIDGATLTVNNGYLGNAIAFYKISRRRTVREPLLIPYGWQYVISGQAGGAVRVIEVFPTGGRPLGGPEPGDTYVPELQKLRSQVADLATRIRKLEGRL